MLKLKLSIFTSLLITLACTGNSALMAGDKTSKKQHERTYYNSWESEIGYAPVVKVGNTLYLSGVTSPGETMAEQVESVYRYIGKILKDHDADYEDIVKETVFTKDIEALKRATAKRKQFFKHKKDPASSWIQIDRLFMEEYLIEVEVIAVIPAK